MLTATQTTALVNAAAQAVACEKETGCPAELTIAQWALESGWGKYGPGNNYFGIKSYSGCYGVQTLTTHEYVNGKPEEENLEFATFASAETCFAKHAELITKGPRYRSAWSAFQASHDVASLIKGIAGTYAPGNPKYVASVQSIIGMPAVAHALLLASVKAA